VIGGLVSATLLTLFVLPTLYLIVERRSVQEAAGVPPVSAIAEA
jgi:Cu/Ag efflux pump CusA